MEAWALREACRQARRWRDATGAPLPVAVNVSVRQFRHPDFAQEVLAIVEEEGLAPCDLWLDVTAPCLAGNPVGVDLVATLRAAGVRLFLDDFGSGEAPLAPLTRCPLDVLKLDPLLVQELQDTDEPPLLAAALAVARTLGLPVLAEGVETGEQRDLLLELGCTLGQGTFFAPPMPAEEALALIMTRSTPPSGGGRTLLFPTARARDARRDARKKLEPARP
jgi:EAL domain-containing protein (putative c-di-GMP-specific phosphodiesterase class I)